MLGKATVVTYHTPQSEGWGEISSPTEGDHISQGRGGREDYHIPKAIRY